MTGDTVTGGTVTGGIVTGGAAEIARLTLAGVEQTIRLVGRDHLLSVPADASRALIVADASTAEFLPPSDLPRVIVPKGEAAKRLEVITSIIDAAIAHRLDRKSALIAFGGGAVTDAAAFSASIYLRGITCILVPTTILAMVDAAVGGKTGVDFAGGKNLVGTFAAAREVRIDPSLAGTLPYRERLSGLAEVLKHAFLADPALLETLDAHRQAILDGDRDLLLRIVPAAVAVKARIVAEDYRESGLRAHLNLGHTFGHALESALGLGVWSHGEAVAWGIGRAMALGVRLGATDPAWARRVVTLLERYGYHLGAPPVDPLLIRRAMDVDKKRGPNGIEFVLQRAAHDTFVRTVPEETLWSVLTQFGDAGQ